MHRVRVVAPGRSDLSVMEPALWSPPAALPVNRLGAPSVCIRPGPKQLLCRWPSRVVEAEGGSGERTLIPVGGIREAGADSCIDDERTQNAQAVDVRETALGNAIPYSTVSVLCAGSSWFAHSDTYFLVNSKRIGSSADVVQMSTMVLTRDLEQHTKASTPRIMPTT